MNKKHFIDEAAKFVRALHENTKIRCKIFGAKECLSRKRLPIDEDFDLPPTFAKIDQDKCRKRKHSSESFSKGAFD